MIDLRPYQIDVTERARARLAEGKRRGIIQGATGSGKTIVSSYITKLAAEKGKKVVFIAHRRRLVQQKSDVLGAFGVEHGIIMAGEQPSSAPVQVASRDTLLSRALRHDWIGFPAADLVIVDEARHSLSPEYQRILQFYKNSFVLGLDATPTTADGKGLGPYYKFLECTVPTSQLVRDGFLVPIRAYSPERAGAARRSGKMVKGLAGDPVSNWLKWGENRPTVLFAAKIMHSQAACRAFNDAGIPAEHIDAKSTDEEREAVIANLRARHTKVVCQCSLWTEGVDIPELSCCILLRLARSCVLFFQAVGRIMRPHPSKKDGILIDHAGAIQEHGFPDEDAEWTLNPDETVDTRVRAAKKAGDRKQAVVCPQCSYTYSGTNTCPACGYVLPKRLRPVEIRHEILTEVERERRSVHTQEDRVRYWHKCLHVMAYKGSTLAAARGMWKGRFGEWPPRSLPHNDFPYDDWYRPVNELLPQYGSRRHHA